jgi:metallo-beta-lactamase family protein
METTYGDRLHKPLGPSIDELFGAITETFKRGGNVVIPTFAVERAQELLYFLNDGIGKGRLSGIDASVSRFAHGDFGYRDIPASPRF